MATTADIALSPAMRRALTALQRGAVLRYAGWQEVRGTFPDAPRELYRGRQQTLYALRDRGLITMGADGITLTDAGRAA